MGTYKPSVAINERDKMGNKYSHLIKIHTGKNVTHAEVNDLLFEALDSSEKKKSKPKSFFTRPLYWLGFIVGFALLVLMFGWP